MTDVPDEMGQQSLALVPDALPGRAARTLAQPASSPSESPGPLTTHRTDPGLPQRLRPHAARDPLQAEFQQQGGPGAPQGALDPDEALWPVKTRVLARTRRLALSMLLPG